MWTTGRDNYPYPTNPNAELHPLIRRDDEAPVRINVYGSIGTPYEVLDEDLYDDFPDALTETEVSDLLWASFAVVFGTFIFVTIMAFIITRSGPL